MTNGLIVKAVSGFYYVDTGNGVYECKARGNFRKTGSPLTGDTVKIEILNETKGIIEEILPRKNFLFRPPCANIDKIFIVSSFSTPAPNTYIIDTMIAIAEDKEIEPIIVFNKADLGDFAVFEEIYKKAGYKVYTISASKGDGIDQLKSEMSGCISVLAGNTGVGKSSILNSLFDNLSLKTGEVSDKLGRGKHTTRHIELYPIKNGGYCADSAGFSSLDIITSDPIKKDNLQFCFKEFNKYIGKCRYNDCTHNTEPGCAVLKAIADGEISSSRIENYKKIYSELSKLNDWEIK